MIKNDIYRSITILAGSRVVCRFNIFSVFLFIINNPAEVQGSERVYYFVT